MRLATELPTPTNPPRGISQRRTEDGITVIRIHYTADPDKDPATPAGKKWLERALVGKPGGMEGKDWKSEMEIDFSVYSGKVVYPPFREEVHVAKSQLVPIPGIPILRGWDAGLCYDDKTEVLTKNGWKLFKDVDEQNDLVATRNPLTGYMEYTSINFKIAKPYKGNLLQWKNNNVNFCVTPEHRVPFTFRDTPEKVNFESAQWLKDHMTGHHYVDLTAKWKPDYDEKQTIMGMLPSVYAEFMGLYLSEGSAWVDLKKKSGGKVTIYQSTPIPEMQNILKSTGLVWRWKNKSANNKGSEGWICCSSSLAAYLKKYGTASEKFIPNEIKDMSKDFILKFIHAFTLGDGSYRSRIGRNEIEHVIYTCSKRMADDFQELALKVGWSASISRVKPSRNALIENGKKRIVNGNGGWVVRFKKIAQRAELLKEYFKEVEYNGTIYCLNVPYHTLFIRRNRVASWNGNTPACSFSQLIPGRYNIFEGLHTTGREGVGITRFGQEVVEYSNVMFPGFKFQDYGDPALLQRSQVDERTCAQVLATMGITIIPGMVGSKARDDVMRVQFERLVDGRPFVQVCPTAIFMIEGFKGAFQYKRIGQTEMFLPDHEKNDVSHVMEGQQYVASRIFQVGDPQGRNAGKHKNKKSVMGRRPDPRR